MSTLGAVLAGGGSSRMGLDKAEVVIGGETMLHRVTSTLREVLPRVVVLGPERPEFECWPDVVAARGPLAGIATALSRMREDRVLVVAVDQPFVRPMTLERLAGLEAAIPVVPVDGEGARQVTCALYPRTISEAALEEGASDGSIQSLLDRVSFQAVIPEIWESWGEDGRSWYSVDTPEALDEGTRRFL